MGGQQDAFLYDYPCPRGIVRLKAGAAFNLRRYQGLIQELARSGWIQHIRANRLNLPILGQIDDLESFMFGSERASLREVATILGSIQEDRCFYCQERITGEAEVDHFIPWTRYPRDTAHNFVLAHRKCNNNKRTMLAAKAHLARWIDHTHKHGDAIAGELSQLGFIADLTSSRQVANWAYDQGIQMKGHGWVRVDHTEMLTPDYLDLFA